MSRIVLTGGPGAGKTSIIDLLSEKGFNIIPEPARTLIEDYEKNSPHLHPKISKENRLLFQIAIEKMTIKDYLDNKTGFFDRSILDEIGYRNRYNIAINTELDFAAKNYRYDKVFIFPFWKEIYKNDAVRHETTEEAEIVSKYLHDAYVRYGYTPIIVPKFTPEKRLEFILDNCI
jgi:predicted ATPase